MMAEWVHRRAESVLCPVKLLDESSSLLGHSDCYNGELLSVSFPQWHLRLSYKDVIFITP